MKIKSIKEIEYTGDVYNLRIKDGENINNNYFANNICVSNCHLAKAKSLSTIASRTFGYAKYRFGMSGTYPPEESAELMTIQAATGPILYSVGAKSLMEKGLISNVKIKSLILLHGELDFAENVHNIKKNGGGKKAYELEKKFAQNSEKRKIFLSKLVNKFKNNSLLLFYNIEYGTELYNYCKSNILEKDFYYIDGNTPSEKREFIKKQMEIIDGNPKILIASFGTLALGVSIKAIRNLVLCDSFKSSQLILQAIGRILRLHVSKDVAIVFDIVDQFHHKYKNTLYKHYEVRKNEIYTKEQYPFEELKIIL